MRMTSVELQINDVMLQVGISMDETIDERQLTDLLRVFDADDSMVRQC